MDSNSSLYCIHKYLRPDECLREPVPVATYGCSYVMLEEQKNKGRKGTLAKFRLTHVPEEVIVYAIDDALETPYPGRGKKFAHPKVFSNLVKQIEDVHCPCDYVIFFKKNHKVHVILCEMKSKKIKDCIPKIKATRCFIEYLKSLIINFEEACPSYLKQDFAYSNILVDLSSNTSQGTLHKNGTHPSVQNLHEMTPSMINDIHRCPLGNQPMRNGAFEMGWASFLRQARINMQ